MTRTLLAAALALAATRAVAAQSAEFWLDTSAVATAGPGVPAPALAVAGRATLYVWGRPADGRQFEALSLNVVLSGPEVDLIDGSYVFYNDSGGGVPRFEFVTASTTTPALLSEFSAFELGLGLGVVDGLYGVNGFNLSDTVPRGPGPVCAAGEPQCVAAGDGDPAWLVASFEVEGLAAGSVDLHLQVGDRGLVESELAPGDYNLDGATGAPDYAVWDAAYGAAGPSAADGTLDGVVDAADYTLWRDHDGHVATLLGVSETSVRFGADGGGMLEPLYDVEVDRDVTLAGDDPDATITVAGPALAVPEPGVAWLAAAIGLIRFARRGPTGPA